MNNRLYGNLIFELSQPGCKAYSLPKNEFGNYEIPNNLKREKDAELLNAMNLQLYAIIQIIVGITLV